VGGWVGGWVGGSRHSGVITTSTGTTKRSTRQKRSPRTTARHMSTFSSFTCVYLPCTPCTQSHSLPPFAFATHVRAITTHDKHTHTHTHTHIHTHTPHTHTHTHTRTHTHARTHTRSRTYSGQPTTGRARCPRGTRPSRPRIRRATVRCRRTTKRNVACQRGEACSR
jgi:hypothetical protein